MSRRSKLKARPDKERTSKTESPASTELPAPSQVPRKIGLELLVFAVGAVLMGLEIAGSRVLAPYFGNSVFVWGSLISVFLVALSVGYFFGGRIADHYPSQALLNSICVAVSLLIFAIALLSRGLCGALVDAGLGEQFGPLVAATLLFLPPSVGMGMVSPFAVRLATRSISSIGKISGTLYALSTGGSIAGTLFTTFVLIPLIGVSTILKGLSLALLVVSLLTFPFSKRARAVASATMIALLILISLASQGPSAAFGRFDETLLDVDTPYHHISVVDNQGSRQLRFDRYIESAILTSPPYPSLARYTNYFHMAFLAKPEIRCTLFIGAGGGIGPREFHMQDPAMEIDVADVDPKVLEIARTHFFLDDSPKIRLFAEDGRMFLRRSANRYDCVILDAFSAGGRIPWHLVTREFLELCRDRMTADGVFLMNINSSLEGRLSPIFQSMYRTFDSVFPNTYVFAMQHRESGDTSTMNIILLATPNKNRISPAEWTARADRHQSQSYVTKAHLNYMLEDLLINLPDVSRAPIFSDDYAPIESMPF